MGHLIIKVFVDPQRRKNLRSRAMEKAQPPGLVSHIFFRCVEDCFEAVMLTDRNGRLTYVNPAWTLTYGYQPADAIGKTPRLLRSANQDDDFYRKMWQTILDPAIGYWRGEVVNRAKDGHLVPVLLTITPYREASGEISGYMGIAVDLTEQKRMEQQILRQDRLASIGLLSGALAHEIGNPLGVIRGRAELVMNQVRSDEVAAKNLEVIIGQIDRISALIQSLLRVSRVPEQVLLREVNLEAAVEEVVILVGESCRRAEIEMRYRGLAQNISAEPSHMQQLLLNLIINAMHAIEEKRSKMSPSEVSSAADFIEISASQIANGRCLIEVRDTGCGISPEVMRKLFQPFFTTKGAGKGTGLGLAIVAKLVEEMNGTVSVESPGPGLGAIFKLEFDSAAAKTHSSFENSSSSVSVSSPLAPLP